MNTFIGLLIALLTVSAALAPSVNRYFEDKAPKLEFTFRDWEEGPALLVMNDSNYPGYVGKISTSLLIDSITVNMVYPVPSDDNFKQDFIECKPKSVSVVRFRNSPRINLGILNEMKEIGYGYPTPEYDRRVRLKEYKKFRKLLNSLEPFRFSTPNSPIWEDRRFVLEKLSISYHTLEGERLTEGLSEKRNYTIFLIKDLEKTVRLLVSHFERKYELDSL